MEHQHYAKKLYRSANDRIFFGVCGGLGEYFEIDSTIVRLSFVILALASGIGIVGYLIFALVTPKAEGDSVTIPMKDKVKEFAEDSAGYVVEGTKRLADEVRERLPAEKRASRGGLAGVFGIILIVLGVAFLLDNLFPFGFFHKKLLWPFLLMVLGLFMIARSKK